MKPSIASLAKYIGKTEQTLYHKRKVSPLEFELLLNGFKQYCDEKNYKKYVDKSGIKQ